MDINKEIEKLIEKINKKIKPVSILALEILTPEDVHLNRIKFHIRIASCVDKGKYDQAIREFVYGCDTKNNAPIRSLYYSRYKECIKYHERTETSPVDKTHTYTELKRDTIVIDSSVAAEFGSSASIESYWNAWCTTIEKHLSSAISTMWTYVTINSVQEESHKQHISSGYLIFDGKLDSDNRILVNKYVQDFLVSYTTLLFSQSLILAATRAAISQVMARNSSHNIGSHVMNRLTGDLSSLALLDFSKKDELNYQSTYEKDLQELHSEIVKEINNDTDLESLTNGQREKVLKHKILLAQIALFNNYVKCRMDYLADISFGTPLMQTNKYAYEDLFKELDKVRLLLEHISGLDSFKYEIQFKRNGESLTTDNDLLVAIPNDILGTQAFYNILENIIRNTAKHSDKSNHQSGTPIVFTVNFIDENPSKTADANIDDIFNGFIAVEVYDDIAVTEKITDETQKKEYKEKVGNDLTDKIDWLVYSQNKKLNEDILDNNKLRSSSLGLVEMDASAAYLRKRDVGLINDDKYDIEHNDSWRNKTEYKYFLKAFNKDNHLAYRFFLLRPAVVLVVTDAECSNKDKLKKEGIWLITPAEFKKELEAGKVYPHEFVIYEKQEKIDETQTEEKIDIPQLIKDYKTSLPIRVLNTITDLSNLLTKSADEIEKECWKEWEDKKSEVHIVNGYDENYPNKFQAVFLDHLYDENGSFLPKEKIQKYWNVKAKYIEALSSLAQSKMPDFYRINHNEHSHKKTSSENFKCYLRELNSRNLIKQKIKEAILSKVIVIDERIQNTTKELDKGGKEFMTIPFKCLYAKMGVIVPDVSLNLSENSFATIKSELEQYIEKEISRAKSTDFILIHYSILERMYNDKTLIKTKLEEWTKSINVVITSGRGIPDGLTERVRFVNLSSVITTFVDVRSKYAINYLLNSSRKSNKI